MHRCLLCVAPYIGVSHRAAILAAPEPIVNAPPRGFREHHTRLLTVGCGLDSLRSWPGWHVFSHLVCPVASLSEETVDPEPAQKPGPKGRPQSEVGVPRNSDSTALGMRSPERRICPRNSALAQGIRQLARARG